MLSSSASSTRAGFSPPVQMQPGRMRVSKQRAAASPASGTSQGLLLPSEGHLEVKGGTPTFPRSVLVGLFRLSLHHLDHCSVLRFLLPEETQVPVTQGCVYERTVWGQMWLGPRQQMPWLDPQGFPSPQLIVRGEGRLAPLLLSSWLEAFRPLGDLYRLPCDPGHSLPSSLTWRESRPWP